MNNYLLNDATVKSAQNSPELPALPELDAVGRAKLYKYLMIVRQSFLTYLKLFPNDNGYEFVHGTGVLFTAATMALLDGANTVEEYLNRDKTCTYSFTSSHDILIEKDDNASYICPKCKNRVEFPITPENYEILEEWCGTLCCPYCLENDEDIRRVVLECDDSE